MTLLTEPTAREAIPTLLDQHRPDRYDPADHAWQDPVIDMVASEISEAEARTIAAGRLVSTAEASATRRTNKLMRAIRESGSWPIEWMDAMAWPLAVSEGERVALRAATADDFRAFATRERRAAALDFSARNDACEGALAVADAMEAQGAAIAAQLAPAVVIR